MSAAELTVARPGHELDAGRLDDYFRSRIPDYQGPLSIRQFAGGQSNPTYLLTGPKTSYVLRKKPGGALLQGAHLIEREYRVMSALAETAVPVPKTLSLCEDPTVLGTPFFVMEHIKGRIMRSASVPGVTIEDRAALYDAMNGTAAALHSVDWEAAGLSDFGKRHDYILRQVRLWSRQYQASKTHPIPALERLIEWLPEHIPAGEETRIAHGDFRLENLIFHPTRNEVSAVLDWELATLGHPLSDLAFNCMVYHVPPEMPGIRGIAGLNLKALGIPSEVEYVAAYCRRTGRDAIADWDYYVAFAMFRSAAILQGVYTRALQNNASNPDALAVGRAAEPLANLAWQQIAHLA
jgi:aminoglycoside phosphotransferase (APT) family kinase protein